MTASDIKVLHILEVPNAQPGGKLSTVTRYTIMIGEHGPFRKDFAAGADSAEMVNAWKMAKLAQINATA